MGRPAKGWGLRLDPRTGVYTVRFSVRGQRVHRSTHERDRAAADRKAQALYAEAIVGAAKAGSAPRGVARAPDLLTRAVADWIDAMSSVLDAATVTTYEIYASAHWFPRWTHVGEIDRAAGNAYARDRLRHVLRASVCKELSALRGLLRWLREQGRIGDMPVIDQPPKRAVGAAVEGMRRQAVELDEHEVEAILCELPEWSDGGPRGSRYRVRAPLILAWETGLRPATIAALRTPDDYRPGARALTIRREADKARAGRPVPLSARARAVLDAVAPAEGEVFGAHDLRVYLRAAALRAAAAGHLAATKARRVTVYDLRHARITVWAESGDLPAMMLLAGHRHASTTSRYIRIAEDRARVLLERTSESGPPPAPLVPGDQLEARRGSGHRGGHGASGGSRSKVARISRKPSKIK